VFGMYNLAGFVFYYLTQIGKCLKVLTEHSHFVQGVAWSPIYPYFASQSSDRSVIVYSYTLTNTPSDGSSPSVAAINVTILNKNTKLAQKRKAKPSMISSVHTTDDLDTLASEIDVDAAPKEVKKPVRMYHDETLLSFFRRLAFLVDGSLLLSPAAQIRSLNSLSSPSKQLEPDADISNTVFIHANSQFDKYFLVSSFFNRKRSNRTSSWTQETSNRRKMFTRLIHTPSRYQPCLQSALPHDLRCRHKRYRPHLRYTALYSHRCAR
jgi:WD40 repeat protein